MGKITFDEERCKSCKLCVFACPKKIIEINKDKINLKGFNPIRVTNIQECIGCAFCAITCPDCVIQVEK